MRAAEFKTSERLRCLLCGGGRCKRCGATAYQQQERRGQVPALPRTHSSWITPDIVGMQRPNNALLLEGLLQAFEQHNIRCIFNLTRPGEHPHCGALRGATSSSAVVAPAPPTNNNSNSEAIDGSDKSSTAIAGSDKSNAIITCSSSSTRGSSSRFIDTFVGFPYDPELVMAAGMSHFNYSWPDMTTPPLPLMRHIVEVACGELRRGHRLAVHCHAGFGRTGIAICCVLLARDFCGPRTGAAAEVIALVRSSRPGSVQTSRQARFVSSFQDELCGAHALFPAPGSTRKSFKRSAEDDVFCHITCRAHGPLSSDVHPVLPPTIALLLDALRRWRAGCGLTASGAAARLFVQADGRSADAAASALSRGDPSALQALVGGALDPPSGDGSEAAAALLRMLSLYLCTRSEALASPALLQRFHALLAASPGASQSKAAAEACQDEGPTRRSLLLALATALPADEELLQLFATCILGAEPPVAAVAAARELLDALVCSDVGGAS